MQGLVVYGMLNNGYHPDSHEFFTRSNARQGDTRLEEELAWATRLPLPSYLQPVAQAIQTKLFQLFPEETYFQPEFPLEEKLVEEYLNQETLTQDYLQLNRELRQLIVERDWPLRHFVLSDLRSTSPVQGFYLRQDWVLPVLERGEVYTLENGTTIETYDQDSYRLQRTDGQILILDEEELFDYLDREENIRPYTYQEIPRRDLALLDGQVSYMNRETGEVSLLPEQRLFIRNVGLILELVNNGQYLLGLALLFLQSK